MSIRVFVVYFFFSPCHLKFRHTHSDSDSIFISTFCFKRSCDTKYLYFHAELIKLSLTVSVLSFVAVIANTDP